MPAVSVWIGGTAMSRRSAPRIAPENELVNGDRMTQAEFHRRYEHYPEDVKFELVGGIVYMASPLRLPHSRYDDELGYLLGSYRRATEGTEVLHGATTILGPESEPQPDLGLRILPEFGGQSGDTEDEYVTGAPELLVEVAHSTKALDMHAKRRDYRLAGVREYLVLCVKERQLHWFRFPGGRVRPKTDGILRSRIFPGLWIDGAALLARNSARLSEALNQGLASKAHAAFVERLRAARR
jgi:Uma2 family endonuclease